MNWEYGTWDWLAWCMPNWLNTVISTTAMMTQMAMFLDKIVHIYSLCDTQLEAHFRLILSRLSLQHPTCHPALQAASHEINFPAFDHARHPACGPATCRKRAFTWRR